MKFKKSIRKMEAGGTNSQASQKSKSSSGIP